MVLFDKDGEAFRDDGLASGDCDGVAIDGGIRSLIWSSRLASSKDCIRCPGSRPDNAANIIYTLVFNLIYLVSKMLIMCHLMVSRQTRPTLELERFVVYCEVAWALMLPCILQPF